MLSDQLIYRQSHTTHPGLYLDNNHLSRQRSKIIDEIESNVVIYDSPAKFLTEYVTHDDTTSQRLINQLSPIYRNRDLAQIINDHYYLLGYGLTVKIALSHAEHALETAYNNWAPAGYSNFAAYKWCHLDPAHLIAINIRDEHHYANQIFLFHKRTYDPVKEFVNVPVK